MGGFNIGGRHYSEEGLLEEWDGSNWRVSSEDVVRRSSVWCKQANWYWDPTNGDDQNYGHTVGNPVKTFAEIARRLGTEPLQQLTDVWLMGDTTEVITAPQTLQLQDGAAGVSYMLRIRGDLGITTKVDSTFTGSTALNAATNTPTDVTDAGVNWNTAFDGGSALGHRLRRKSDNAIGWIMKIVSNTQARTSAWLTLDPFAANPSIAPTLQTNPGSNPYVLERLPKIGGVNLSVNRNGRTSASNFVSVLLDSLWYDETNGAPGIQIGSSNVGYAYVSRSKIGGVTSGQAVRFGGFGRGLLYWINNCVHALTSAGPVGPNGILMVGGGCIGSMLQTTVTECMIQLQRHYMVQSPGSLGLALLKAIVATDGLCVFDSTGPGISIIQGGQSRLTLSGSSALWGSGNATFGADVPAGTVIQAGSTVPILTGGTAQVRVAGDAGDTWAAKIAAGFLTNKLAGVVQA